MAQASKVSTTSPAPKRAPRTLAGTVVPQSDTARAQTLALYEAAIHLMQQGKYDKAHSAFNQMLQSAPLELRDRIRVKINACLLQVSKGKTTFLSHEEEYDYAIYLLNDGNYSDARKHFEEISKHPGAEYAFYGLAVLSSLTGDSEQCLTHLAEAIKANPRHRIQARADSDFHNMADDPRFTELLYPEV